MDWKLPPPTVVYLDGEMQMVPKEKAMWEKRWFPDGSVSFTLLKDGEPANVRP